MELVVIIAEYDNTQQLIISSYFILMSGNKVYFLYRFPTDVSLF
jgi:hypothetical protein